VKRWSRDAVEKGNPLKCAAFGRQKLSWVFAERLRPSTTRVAARDA